jgi:hypothetical protein
VKACLTSMLLLFLAAPAGAAERMHSAAATFTARPKTSAGMAIHRGPASEQSFAQAVANKKLFSAAKPGDRFIVQNSVHELDDEVVVVQDVFEDGSLRVKRGNGKRAFVRAQNLAATLSPEIDCGDSFGEKICRGDVVFYPVRSSSLEIPKAKVTYVFANGSVVVQDGAEFVFNLPQVGKLAKCSPQRESICVGDYVYAESFRKDEKFTFEGDVEEAYTNGVVLVKVNGRWRYPIDVTAVKERIATDNPIFNSGAVITTRTSRSKEAVPVSPELEPNDPNQSDRANDAR